MPRAVEVYVDCRCFSHASSVGARPRWESGGAGSGAERLDPVEDRLGDLASLEPSGTSVLAPALDDRDLVALASRSRSRRGDVVEDDRVDALALELAAGALDAVAAVLGGEADQGLASGRAGRRAPARMSSVGSSSQLDAAAALAGELALGGAAGRKSAGAPPSAARRSAGNSARDRARQLGGGLDVDPADARRRRERDVGGDEGDLGAAARRRGGERQAHPAAGAVADEAHRVDRLAGPAGA